MLCYKIEYNTDNSTNITVYSAMNRLTDIAYKQCMHDVMQRSLQLIVQNTKPLSTTSAIHFNIWRMLRSFPNSCLQVHIYSRSCFQLRVVRLMWPGDISKMCFVFLVKQHATLKCMKRRNFQASYFLRKVQKEVTWENEVPFLLLIFSVTCLLEIILIDSCTWSYSKTKYWYYSDTVYIAFVYAIALLLFLC